MYFSFFRFGMIYRVKFGLHICCFSIVKMFYIDRNKLCV